MPTAVFPRNTGQEPVDVDLPMFRVGGHRNISQSGVAGLRNVTAKGVRWSETYPPLKSGDSNAESFLAWINWAFNTNQEFTITHPLAHGSGLSPLGSGTAGVTVSGVNSGEDITVSAGTYEAGDWVSIAGYGFAMQITESDTGTLHIIPPIVNPTSGGEAVTTTGVTFNCIIESMQKARIQSNRLPFHYTELTLNFLEIPN